MLRKICIHTGAKKDDDSSDDEEAKLRSEDGHESEEDEEDDRLTYKMRMRARHRAAWALVLGFLCCFPWLFGFAIYGGTKSRDRITR
jgi:hypothetical protein